MVIRGLVDVVGGDEDDDVGDEHDNSTTNTATNKRQAPHSTMPCCFSAEKLKVPHY